MGRNYLWNLECFLEDCSLVVNGQSFLLLDGNLLNPLFLCYFSILILSLSYLLSVLSLISEFGGGTGWTLYPPLSTSFMSLSPSSTGNLILALLVSGVSSCLTSLNFWVTILNLRSYCLTLKTMPLFPWALLITAAML